MEVRNLRKRGPAASEQEKEMNLLNQVKRGWQPNLNIRDKKLQMNQQNVEKRDC